MPSGRLQVVVKSIEAPETSGCYCVLLGPGGQRFVTEKCGQATPASQKFTVDIPAGTNKLQVEMYSDSQPGSPVGAATCSLHSVFDQDQVHEQVPLLQGENTVGGINVGLRFFRERSFERNRTLPNNTEAWRSHRRGHLDHAPLHHGNGLTTRA